MRRLALLLASVGLLAGCATAFPGAALEGVNRAVMLANLRASPQTYLNQRVILGGEVVSTMPKPDGTEIEVLGRPLRSDDAPERTDRSDGRFIIKSSQFLDPAIYAAGRRLTVIGTMTGVEERKLGDVPYQYPGIASEQIRLWARDVPAAYYPYYPYPYWGPYPYGFYFGYRRYPYWW
jgi:outer membrane lipoprotein